MLNFASAGRNIAPITDILKKQIPSGQQMKALELASGSGQHIVQHAKTFPNIRWFPTDIENNHIDSINAYVKKENLNNVSTAKYLDATADEWEFEENSLDIIINVNLIHISPFEVAKSLISHAGKLLKSGGQLIFYGPFAKDGKLSPQSNVDFDASLKSRNSSWGIRDITEVSALAQDAGLSLTASFDMPANNNMYFFTKS